MKISAKTAKCDDREEDEYLSHSAPLFSGNKSTFHATNPTQTKQNQTKPNQTKPNDFNYLAFKGVCDFAHFALDLLSK